MRRRPKRRKRRCRIFHSWYLRLDDWRLECTRCGAIKRERKRHKAR